MSALFYSQVWRELSKRQRQCLIRCRAAHPYPTRAVSDLELRAFVALRTRGLAELVDAEQDLYLLTDEGRKVHAYGGRP